MHNKTDNAAEGALNSEESFLIKGASNSIKTIQYIPLYSSGHTAQPYIPFYS